MPDPFNRRLPTKVKRTVLPYQFLKEMDKEAQTEFLAILRAGFKIVEMELVNSLPDPDENELIGLNVEPLKQSSPSEPLKKNLVVKLDQAQTEAALKAYERRFLFNGPLNTGKHITKSLAMTLINMMGFDGGSIEFQDTVLLEATKAYKPKEEIVAVKLLSPGAILRSDELRSVLLTHKDELVVVKRVKGTNEMRVTSGMATWIAASILGIPGIIASVTDLEDVTQRDFGQGIQDSQEFVNTYSEALESVKYRLPSNLEPLAELARRMDLETFLIVGHHELSPSEIRGRDRADEAGVKVRVVWAKLFNDYRAQGMTDDQGSAAIRKNSLFTTVEDREEQLLDRVVGVEEKWYAKRELYRNLKESSDALTYDDGLEPLGKLNLTLFWEEARKGKAPEEIDEDKGLVGSAYSIDQLVEIRDPKGVWHKGTVTDTRLHEVKVKREDGQTRKILNPSSIRLQGDKQGNLGLDKSDEMLYNSGMKPIVVDKFNVLIPAGSNSLKIEEALKPITEEMNHTPLMVNEDTWLKNLHKINAEWDRLVAQCRTITMNPEFRPNAPSDCVEEFFGKRELPIQRVSKKTGAPTCDKEVLASLESLGDDLAPVVIEAREARSKLSQLESWKTYAKVGLVQCNWNSLGTPMGRYTADSPNLQNRITEIRETIEAPQGEKFLSFDLGQAEYVGWASLSRDPTLSKAFIEDKDFHEVMWAEIKAAAPELNIHGKDPRKMGKTVNFALLYLMKPFTLAKKLGVSVEDATKIIATYAARAPIAISYREEVLAEAKRTGMIETKYGRNRHIPMLKTARGGLLHEFEKTAWHHHNSGTAAEILKIKQIKAMHRLRAAGFTQDRVKLVLQMHDELIFQVKDEVLAEVRELVQVVMDEVVPGFLKFKIDTRVGQNWLETSK